MEKRWRRRMQKRENNSNNAQQKKVLAFKDMRTVKEKVVYNAAGEPIRLKVPLCDQLMNGKNVHVHGHGHRKKRSKGVLTRLSLVERQSVKRESESERGFCSGRLDDKFMAAPHPDLCRTVETVRKILRDKSYRSNDHMISMQIIVRSNFTRKFGDTSVRDQNLKQFYNSLLINQRNSALLRIVVNTLGLEEENSISFEAEKLYLIMRNWLLGHAIYTCEKNTLYPSWFISRSLLETSFEAALHTLGCYISPSLVSDVNHFINDNSIENDIIDMDEGLEGIITLYKDFDKITCNISYKLFGEGAFPKSMTTLAENSSFSRKWQVDLSIGLLRIKALIDTFFLRDVTRQGEVHLDVFRELCVNWVCDISQNSAIEKFAPNFIGKQGILYFEAIASLHLQVLQGEPHLFLSIEDEQYYESETLQLISEYAMHARCYAPNHRTGKERYGESVIDHGFVEEGKNEPLNIAVYKQ